MAKGAAGWLAVALLTASQRKAAYRPDQRRRTNSVMKTTGAQSRSTASGGYVLPLNLERRDEAGASSGLVGVGGDSLNNKP